MLKTLLVVLNSLKMALNELKVNKLRTFLSLFGVTIGIFCIIGVLATVESLEMNVKDGLKDLGNNTIYVQKFGWGAEAGNYPWWKYMKRPDAKFEEMKQIKEMSNYTDAAAFMLFNKSNVEYKNVVLQNVTWYGATEDFNRIQDVKVEEGRYISASEFYNGTPVVVMGNENANKLFGSGEQALGKPIQIAGRTAVVVGIVKKAGQSLVGGWDFDNIIIVPFNFCRQVVSEKTASRFLLVKGKEGIPIQDLKDELTGIMRNVRKLRPTEGDNFSLNDVNSSAKQLESFFGIVNLGGFIIGGFSLIVGLFGIANIMFVTVKERTSQIGLKKAIGAKKSDILTEFLLESSFLCIVGGGLGLLLIWLISLALSTVLPFPIFLSPGIIALGLSISIVVGLLAGIIPAFTAARLDPVVAIRSK